MKDYVIERAKGRVCTLPDCDRPWCVKGLCSLHYSRLRRLGDVNAYTSPAFRRQNVDKAFAERTERQGDCLVWTGRRNPHGYGMISYIGKEWSTHRLAWHYFVGPIPDGMYILHKCDNPPCVNLDHLYVGTHQQNMADMDARGRRRGVVLTPGHNTGSKHPLAKLTETDVVLIRQRFAAGAKARELGETYGVDPETVRDIVKRRRWKHVP